MLFDSHEGSRNHVNERMSLGLWTPREVVAHQDIEEGAMDAIDRLRILLIGSGGREHALAWKLSQSPRVDSIHVVPGNGGTARGLDKVENVDTVKADDFPGLVAFAREKNVNLLVPGPEAALVAGIEGHFRKGKLQMQTMFVEETLADGCTKPPSDALDLLRRLPAWKAQRLSPKISWLDGTFRPPSIGISAIMKRRDYILIVLLTKLSLRQMGCMYNSESPIPLLHNFPTHGSCPRANAILNSCNGCVAR